MFSCNLACGEKSSQPFFLTIKSVFLAAEDARLFLANHFSNKVFTTENVKSFSSGRTEIYYYLFIIQIRRLDNNSRYKHGCNKH